VRVKIVVELNSDPLCSRISNRPHRPNNATVPSGEHASCEVNSLFDEFLVTSTGLARGEESEVGVLEVLLDDGREVESPAMEEEFAGERVLHVLRSMTCEVDAAEALEVVKTLLRGDIISVERFNPCHMLQ
jgi:hypothetical protein